jgi:hypothetical protein
MEAKMRADTGEAIKKGGNDGCVIVYFRRSLLLIEIHSGHKFKVNSIF